jgi:exosortase/archaeosortase family protein
LLPETQKDSVGESSARFYFIFFVKILLIYLGWKVFQFVIGEESQPLNERFFPQLSFYWEWLNIQLRVLLLHVSKECLNLLGYPSVITDDYIINIIGYRGVAIGNYCLAFQFMYFFTALVLLGPFSIRVKLWAIPLGCVLIQAVNVFRFVGLCLVIVHFPGWEEKMHDYFFNAAALAVALLVYMKLLSRFG